jgi:hypothetical protein
MFLKLHFSERYTDKSFFIVIYLIFASWSEWLIDYSNIAMYDMLYTNSSTLQTRGTASVV